MRILLLGANGQLGWELRRSLAPLGEVLALGHGEDGADLAQPAGLTKLVERTAPDAIVNAAAYTAVDKAESEPEQAQAVNAEAPGVLARAAAARGALLVHYSSDYVFDGSGDTARGENAATGPLSAYGLSKLAGEEAVRESGARHLILRTSWVYAARGQNFPKTMLRLAQQREMLRVVADQVGAPTGAELLADVSAHALKALGQSPRHAGTYHVAAAGETSWHGLAQFAIEQARALRPDLPWQVRAIEPIATADYPTPARRPLNSRLDTTRLREAFGLSLPDWRVGVQRMLSEHLTHP